MLRLQCAALTTLLLMTFATTAEAKERHSLTARVCGAGHCVVIRDARLVSSVFHYSEAFNMVDPPPPAAFWKIEFRWSKNAFPPTRYLYVPSRQRIRIHAPDAMYWRLLPEALEDPLERMTRTLEPYSARRRWPR
jgi:hypothetical protein